MKKTQRIRANEYVFKMVLSLLLIIATVLFRLGFFPTSTGKLALLTTCSIAISFGAIFHFVHPVYLTDEGIECFHLNKIYRKIFWDQVENVYKLTDFRYSSGVSDLGRFVIVPNGCPQYDKHKWFGLQYIFIFRKQVVCIDNTSKNRQYIEKHYGNITEA